MSLCFPEGFETTFRELSANRIPSAGEETVKRRTLRVDWRISVPCAARSLGDVRNGTRRASIASKARCGFRHLFPVAVAAVVHRREETPGKTQHRRAGIEPDLPKKIIRVRANIVFAAKNPRTLKANSRTKRISRHDESRSSWRHCCRRLAVLRAVSTISHRPSTKGFTKFVQMCRFPRVR